MNTNVFNWSTDTLKCWQIYFLDVKISRPNRPHLIQTEQDSVRCFKNLPSWSFS